jgi:predicted aspartyl protease
MPSRSRRIPAVIFTGFFLCIFSLISLAEPHESANLKSLYESRRWFELRDAVAKQPTVPLFYQGAVACAFNDLRDCERKMAAVIKSRPGSDDAIEAHRLLAAAYFRQGKYRKALVQVDDVLAIRPDDPDLRNDRPLLAALHDFPDQRVIRRHHTTLELQDAGLPISLNGVQGAYWFDTGADLSALSESDARRFGLRILTAHFKEGDVAGNEIDSRIAVADEISIGSFRVRHVAFLIFSDAQPPFNELPAGSRGLIGLPVLLAMQEFVWRADKKFEIASRASPRDLPRANLCFNEHNPVLQIQYEQRNVSFALDTGATNTDLYPSFAARFPDLIRTGTKESYKTEGVGGAKTLDAVTIPSVQLSITGVRLTLSPAHLLMTHTTEASKFFDGNLGIDLLQQAHRATFDFRAMRLTLE